MKNPITIFMSSRTMYVYHIFATKSDRIGVFKSNGFATDKNYLYIRLTIDWRDNSKKWNITVSESSKQSLTVMSILRKLNQ